MRLRKVPEGRSVLSLGSFARSFAHFLPSHFLCLPVSFPIHPSPALTLPPSLFLSFFLSPFSPSTRPHLSFCLHLSFFLSFSLPPSLPPSISLPPSFPLSISFSLPLSLSLRTADLQSPWLLPVRVLAKHHTTIPLPTHTLAELFRAEL